jgi:hypothetical protein
MKTEITDGTKHAVDALSLITVLGTLVDMLPSIAAIFTIVWTCIRIWETDTVRTLTRRNQKVTDVEPE